MTDTTNADIAAMPRIADATLAETFRWRATEEERLYRECPTAFWLAPEPDGILPPTFDTTPAPACEEGKGISSFSGQMRSIGFGIAFAGPIFLATLGLAIQGEGNVIAKVGMMIALALFSAPISIPLGAIAAALPVILGVSILANLGITRTVARHRSLWAATGAGMGLAISALFDAGPVTIPLVLTAIACATIARSNIDWTDAQPA